MKKFKPLIRINWKTIQNGLYSRTLEVINQFKEKNNNVEICSFSFDSDPRYGYFIFSFETPGNSLEKAIESEAYNYKRIENDLNDKSIPNWEKGYLMNALCFQKPFNDNTGDYKFPFFSDITFKELKMYGDLLEKKNYLYKEESSEYKYLYTNTQIICWNIINRIVKENIFNNLNISKPFILGLQFHDSDLMVMRIINWPKY